MKAFRIVARILPGLVFIFSGFVKAVDPMGSAIKFTEYFEAFHMTWIGPAALVLSILLSTAEFLIGIALVTGLRMKTTAWAALLFMSFFTLVTFYSALKSPVSDCGCFGDALVITNWQTFYKNVVLIAIVIFVFYSRKKYVQFATPAYEWMLVAFFACFEAGISVYSLNHLPILDFRPYHIGTHIPSKMMMPEGVKGDEYQTTLYYEKNGIVKEFTSKNYPWQDSTWKFKDQKSTLLKKGYTPPIHGFSITTGADQDITSEFLADTSYAFVFISHDIEAVKPFLWDAVKSYASFANAKNHKFYFVTSSTHEAVASVQNKYKLPFECFYADQTTLKTIIRSNPGLMLLKDGVVLGLWHYNDLPVPEYFKGNILSKVLTDYHKSIEHKNLFFIVIALLCIFLGMLGYRRYSMPKLK